MKTILFSIITFWGACCYGQEQMIDTLEIHAILKQLCQKTSQGWIQQGCIEGIHLSFDSASGDTMQTLESVTTDGERFIWTLRIPDGNERESINGQNAKEFLTWNQGRTFIWDGLLYTLYFKPGNHAIVYERPSIPVVVTGPLKAGYIPWGQGLFTYEGLSTAQPSGKRVETKDGPQIHLWIEPMDNMLMEFVLDPQKDNAVLSYTVHRADSRTVQSYGDFVEHNRRWIPMNILIDRFQNNRLIDSHVWEITLLKDAVPAQDSFVIAFEQDALVEYHSPMLQKPTFYRHSKSQDIELLLEKRFVAALKKDVQKQNCATVAVEKILSDLGITATKVDLESLVRGDSDASSLYQIQQFLLRKGLYTLPVKTNIKGLEKYKNAKILLHFPVKKHFVVLDKILKKKIWLIDLDRQTFYHSMDRGRFKEEWAGIALVVSDKPLSLGRNDKPIPERVLQKIVGSADYSCTLVQESMTETCPNMSPMGTCDGRFTIWQDYYACQADSEGGFCSGTGTVGGTYTPCVESSNNECDTNGEFIALNIRACLP